jgi:formylglycine-generating enzyme required for sulfatase activity
MFSHLLSKSHRQGKVHGVSQPCAFSFETVTLDRRGEVVARTAGTARQVIQSLPGGAALELVEIPGGFFQMGSRHEGGYEDERPLHPVFLGEFWLGKTPVTQAQWLAVMGRLPPCRYHGADLPVENISWKEAAAFCNCLANLTGEKYHLPSEAQWEYACRAGTVTPFSLGETITTDYANYVGEHTFREELPGIYRHGTTPVGSFLPNPWGLQDMHGLVWEFCADGWRDDYSGAPVDGSAQSPGRPSQDREPAWRVARGGSWHETPGHCRSAVRLKVAEDDRMEFYGLRVALNS